ncbi:MAG: serine hydrolase [Actinobacteria bacterium]|nr:MAG: serine hydrolase [Actinomycetota bacterium]
MFLLISPPPTLTPPVLTAPQPRQVSFGVVSGWVAAATQRVVVVADGHALADQPVSSRRMRLVVRLPSRDVTLRVIAIDAAGRHAATSVGPVFGLPPAARPRAVLSREDPVLERKVRRLAQGFGGIASVYVEDIATGQGAAWNARARYPAASTVKLAIAVETLRRLRGPPPAGSELDTLLRDMLVYSDNDAANALEVWLGGSVPGGAEDVNEALETVGLQSTRMYGGFLADAAGTGVEIPLTLEDEPPFGIEKYTTAWDLARLAWWVHLAAAGRGPLVHRLHDFTPGEARFLLFVLAHSADHGKLDRYLASDGVTVLHKAGWITNARHDSGLVYWRGGAFVATVMTWNPVAAGVDSDDLAGQVAQAALTRFRALRAERGTTTRSHAA